MPKLDYSIAGYKGLSYSRRKTLHTCARKFQLENSFGFADKSQDSVTFSYGHAVAAGIQEYFATSNANKALLACSLHYTFDWDDPGSLKEERAKKNIWYALESTLRYINGIKRFMYGSLSKLHDYELAYVNVPGSDSPIPAIELQFRILLNDDFVYEGHIDLILRHKETGEFVIVEIKTTSLTPHEAMYQNSPQALSYSIVLDRLAYHLQGKATFKIFYLVYQSGKMEWHVFEFQKSVKKRFDWINNLIRDCELLEYYQATAVDGIPYPTNGESCYQYFKPCEYLTVCEMDDDNLHKIFPVKQSKFEYTDNTHFEFTLEEIINTQIELAEERTGIEINLADQDIEL